MVLIFKKYKYIDFKRGMTYVELIVVLSIFATMSSIIMFNYNTFQANVDIKNLASDIALKLVQAQKYAVSGKLPSTTQQIAISVLPGGLNAWKPSYGLYFDTSSLANQKKFIYFTDIVKDSNYVSGDGELAEQVNINKGDYVSRIDTYLASSPTQKTNPISITFERPNSSAVFYDSTLLTKLTGFDYMQITISSPSSTPVTSRILIYPSGRIEIK